MEENMLLIDIDDKIGFDLNDSGFRFGPLIVCWCKSKTVYDALELYETFMKADIIEKSRGEMK
jgi:hypothetical protein